jgi:hypothetical protein
MEKEKFNLSQDQRDRIRWSTTKTGYVLYAVHYQGPRGGRFRPNVIFVGLTKTDALRESAKYFWKTWKPPIRKLYLYKVDALGRVLEEVEIPDEALEAEVA